MVNYCPTCNGSGRVPAPRKWWQVWRVVTCPTCRGDGYAHPPGWPDKAEMRRWRPTPPPPPPPPLLRHAFTLVELLVVVTIIGCLAALVLGGVQAARESAREVRTEATIARIAAVIEPAWESYASARVPGILSPHAETNLQGRWNARRDLLRLNMPDRWSDVTEPPLFLPATRLDHNGDGIPDEVFGTSLQRHYQRLLEASAKRLAHLPPDEQTRKRKAYELSECLYMVVMAHGGNEVCWREHDRGDLDDDGLPEFHDGWGRPIICLRWPAGWPGAEPPPIGFDPPANPVLLTLGPRPLICSAGPDGIFDVNRGVQPDPTGGWETYRYGIDIYGNLNPWCLDENTPPCGIGIPRDATALDGTAANGSLDHFDNVTNYDLSR